jgi:hypothetical protein
LTFDLFPGGGIIVKIRMTAKTTKIELTTSVEKPADGDK